MTDHPRFEPLRGSPDTMHLRYHGGALVASVLRLADQWAARPAWPQRPRSPGKPARAVRRARLRALLTALIILGAVLLTALWAPGRQAGNRPSPPQPPQKVTVALA